MARTFVGMVFCAATLLFTACALPIWAETAGGLEWCYAAPEKILFAPAVSGTGASYIVTDDQQIRAITPNGRLLWAVNPGGKPTTGLVLQDGLLFFGTSRAELAAYSTSGAMIWRKTVDDILLSPPAVAADGTVYAVTRLGTLYAVSAAGRIKWTFPTGDPVLYSPVVALSGRIYVGSTRHFFALEPTGEVAWIWTLASAPASQTAIDGSDGLCFVDGTPTLHHLDSHGLETWFQDSDAAASPVITADAVVVCQGEAAPPPSGHSIGGKVTLDVPSDTPVTVTTTSASATTGSDGKYKLRGLANGTYTVTPSLEGYTFYPVVRNVILRNANVGSQNFVGTKDQPGAAPRRPMTDPPAESPAPEDSISNDVTVWKLDGSTSASATYGSPYAPAVATDGILVPGNDYNIDLFAYQFDPESKLSLTKTIPFGQAPRDVTLAATDKGNRIYAVGGDRFLYCVATSLQPDASAPWGQLGAGPSRTNRRSSPPG